MILCTKNGKEKREGKLFSDLFPVILIQLVA